MNDDVQRLQAPVLAVCDEFATALAWDPAGKRLAVGAADGSVAVYDTDTGELYWRQVKHFPGTACLGWSHDGTRLASGGHDGRVRLWDGADGSLLWEYRAGDWVAHVHWLADGAAVVAVAGRHVLRLDSADGACGARFEADSTRSDLRPDPCSDGLLSAGYGNIHLHDPATLESRHTFHWKGSMLCAAASPNGRWLVGGCQDKAVHIWDRNTGADLMMSGFSSKVGQLSWDASGDLLATGGGAEVIVWNCGGKGPEGKEPLVLSAHQSPIEALAFDHRGKRLASGGGDGLLLLVDVAGETIRAGLLDDSAVSTIAWSPDDATLAVAYASGRIRLCPLDPAEP
ncbi:WD40 repeat protein [Natronocella acetinitrilica]|uniref:WD40 repeat protein n=1 Tax=Natronocella acetinitrilica TaxID=414046 RepID=A0AAE3KB42_9GAMM|nr:PQQ-binding-like beta-propeller repeat protein [Natronocella acetinitrilica]MCP1673143.1 WD40 repeat protein [Natronocella acetinitrilica]